ncbi:MAG: glycosyltransferase family 4 protein [Caldilineaceae bacterium]|nr:glycosyltransferase family 4 protein [Caldilineaceae bacterium]
MNIAINAQLLNTAQTYRGAGVSIYSQNLIHALAKQPHGHRFSIFLNDPAFTIAGMETRRTRWPAHQPLARILWEQGALPLALIREKADLVHGLVNVLPLATRTPGVVTVHDLSFLRMPERFPPAKRIYLGQLCQWSAHKARRVIAVSRQTADDLMHFFGVAAQKIEVVYNGVADHFSPVIDNRFRAKMDLPERFLLYVGTLEPRKNLERLVEAFAEWRAVASPQDQDVALVLAGAQGWFYEQIFGRVRALNLAHVVHFPGFVPAETLPDWYRAALAFVYPSLFEGFGLPVLEAMACGAPVLCSRAPSLLEVAGDAALTFAAEDTAALSTALAQIIGDAALRQDLRQRGLAQARRFSWARCAAETLAVYEDVM